MNKNIVQLYVEDGMRISSLYGMRVHPISGEHTMHYGTDLAGVPGGWPIQAKYPGKIRWVGFHKIFGEVVTVASVERAVILMYCHLRSGTIRVREGQNIKPGDILAGVGTTGYSTGNHLHLEIRHDNGSNMGSPVWGNPATYFEKMEAIKLTEVVTAVTIVDQENSIHTFEGYGVKAAADKPAKTFVELRRFLEYCGGRLGTNNYPHSVGFYKPVLKAGECDPAVENQVQAVFNAQAAYEQALAELALLMKK